MSGEPEEFTIATSHGPCDVRQMAVGRLLDLEQRWEEAAEQSADQLEELQPGQDTGAHYPAEIEAFQRLEDVHNALCADLGKLRRERINREKSMESEN